MDGQRPQSESNPGIGNLVLLRKPGTAVCVSTPTGDIIFGIVGFKASTQVIVSIEAPRDMKILRLDSDGKVEGKERGHGRRHAAANTV